MSSASAAQSPLSNSAEWQALQNSAHLTLNTPLRLQALFAADRERHAQFSCEAAGILLD
jgi:hypothetical protein